MDDAQRDSGAVEALLAKIQQKAEEREALETQVQRARAEVERLRACLNSVGSGGPAMVPSGMRSGSRSLNPQHHEMRSLVQRLADCVDLSTFVIFECGGGAGEMTVGGRRVSLPRMSSWRLMDGSKKLSVPLELQNEIATVLITARSLGKVHEEDMAKMLASWEPVAAEFGPDTVPGAERELALFLIHKVTNQAMVIAEWPSVEFVSPTTFDPAQHFNRVTAAEPPSSQAGEQTCPRKGDRVRVEFQGRCLFGSLQWVDGDVASVQCDVDSPGTMSFFEVSRVRSQLPQAPASQEASLPEVGPSPPSRCSRRVRVMSVPPRRSCGAASPP